MPAESLKIAASGLVEVEDSFLLVSEGGKKASLNLPGGGLDGTESLPDCCVREVEEETGLVVEPVHLVGGYHYPKTAKGNTLLRVVMACAQTGGELRTTKKHKIADFFPYDEITEMHELGRLKPQNILQIIDDYRAGRRYPLSVISFMPEIE